MQGALLRSLVLSIGEWKRLEISMWIWLDSCDCISNVNWSLRWAGRTRGGAEEVVSPLTLHPLPLVQPVCQAVMLPFQTNTHHPSHYPPSLWVDIILGRDRATQYHGLWSLSLVSRERPRSDQLQPQTISEDNRPTLKLISVR